MTQPPGLAHRQARNGTTARANQPPELQGGPRPCMFIDMVDMRKLTKGNYRQFPLWISDFGGELVLQTSGLSERVSVFGHFCAYQIIPNFTNFYQKRAAKGVRRGSKRQLTRAFSRPVLLKRVKSGGSCQSVIGAHFLQRSCDLRAKEPPTQRYRGTEKNDGPLGN